MHAPFRRILAVVLASALVTPTTLVVTARPAAAQPKKPKSVRDTLPKEAIPDWDAALTLASRNPPNYDGARAGFLRAYEASKNPRVLYNVAIAERELGNYVDAMKYLERELAEGKGQLSAEEEAQVQAAIKAIEPFVIKVTVDVNEPGATIFVDKTEVGTSPLKAPLRLTAASHTIRAVKPGYAEAVSTILGDKREATVSLKLESLIRSARVTISVIGPRSAVVKVDGREVGAATSTQPWSGALVASPEPHVVSAEAPEFVTATQSVVVKEGEPLSLALQLAPEQRKGKLLVTTDPSDASIEIDGRVVGATRWEGPVDAGKHQVAVKKRGFYSWNYDVDVPKGGERTVSARLNEDRNTSFVPWLIGTVLVVGAGSLAGYFILKPKDEDKASTTLPPFNVPTPPASIRF